MRRAIIQFLKDYPPYKKGETYNIQTHDYKIDDFIVIGNNIIRKELIKVLYYLDK